MHCQHLTIPVPTTATAVRRGDASEARALGAGKTVNTIRAYSQKHDLMTRISVMTIFVSCHLHNYLFTKIKDKDKDFPLQAWCGPEGG